MWKTTILLGLIAAAAVAGILHMLNSDPASESAAALPADMLPDHPGADDLSAAMKSQPDRYGYQLPGMDCLVNQYGIRRKVIVTGEHVVATGDPRDTDPGADSSGAAARFFTPYYVFDAFPETGTPEYFRVGPTPQEDSVLGWCSASQAATWDTRMGARLADRSFTFNVYATADDQAAVIENPNADVQAVARAKSAAAWTWMPWPIVETRRQEIDGQIYELHRLLFMAQVTDRTGDGVNVRVDRQSLGKGGRQLQSASDFDEVRGELRKVDIVFCVDNTMSTTDYVPEIREALRAIAEQVTGSHTEDPLDVRFRLVLYRDYVPEIMYSRFDGPSVVQSYPTRTGSDPGELATDLQQFLNQTDGITAAVYGSVDRPESVYDGLQEAIQYTAWRGNSLARHVVILVGDDPAHEPADSDHPLGSSRGNPRGVSAADLAALARHESRDVNVISVCVGDSEEFEQLKRQQFEKIATATGGSIHHITETSTVVQKVRELLASARVRAEVELDWTDDLEKGRDIDDLVRESGDPEHMTEFLESLVAAGYDLNSLNPGDAIPQTGWCVAEIDGIRVVDKYVYVARAELQALLNELNLLSMALAPDGARRIHELTLAGRVNPSSFFRSDDASQTMDKFLMASGVPCSQGLLKLSRQEIKHMPESHRRNLKERIENIHMPRLVNALTNAQLWKYRDDIKYAWVPENVFP